MLNIFRKKSRLQQDNEQRLKRYSRRSPILKMAGWQVTGSETYGEKWFIRDFGSYQISLVCFPMRHQYWVQVQASTELNHVPSETMICESPPGTVTDAKKVITQAQLLAAKLLEKSS